MMYGILTILREIGWMASLNQLVAIHSDTEKVDTTKRTTK